MTSERLTRELTALRTTAPDGLRGRILEATGTACRFAVLDGPIGRLAVFFNDRGITGCAPLEHFDEYVAAHDLGHTIEVDELPRALAGRTRRALETGRLKDLPVDLSGLSDFQQDVLRTTATIPPGEIRPYGWIAAAIGRPGAVRAVGSALNKNPVPVLIPCHRVSKSDGHVGNYAYGPQMKRALLSAEGLDPDAAESLADRNVRYTGSDTTHIYCHPSCHAAQRTKVSHTVEFKSAGDARKRGYRPCKLCRPAAA